MNLLLSLLLTVFAAQASGEVEPQLSITEKMDIFIENVNEYLDVGSDEYGYTVEEIVIANVSKELIEVAKKYVDDYKGSLGEGGEVYSVTFYAVKSGDDVIGYAIGIHDYYDHPLWDGSGSTAYFNLDLSYITNIDWAG